MVSLGYNSKNKEGKQNTLKYVVSHFAYLKYSTKVNCIPLLFFSSFSSSPSAFPLTSLSSFSIFLFSPL
jgi:hypothetical protein